MASKRQKSSSSADPRADVVAAALRLAALRDWDNVTLTDIAHEAGTDLAALSQMFECREDIVSAYARKVDALVLKNFTPSGTARDDLFDVLMERFDVLNQNRAAVVSILGSACRDPKQMVIAFPHIARSVAWMVEACGIETIGWRGAARVAGLTGVYLWCLRTWREDDAPDMGKTMATLDKALSRADSIVIKLGF